MRRTKSSFLGSDLFYSSHPNLRIFQKIKMSNPEIKREKQSLVNRGSLLTPEQKQLQKLTLKLHRERYGFHDSLVVPNQMYLIRRELKSNGEKSDPKSVAVRWRNLTTEERKVINEKNLDEKNYYFEQNRIAIKTVLDDENWFALKRSEVQKYGSYKMVVAYNEEWKELLTGQVEKESWSKFVLNNAKQDVDRVTAAKAKKATEKKLETYKKISKSLRLQFSTNKRKG